MYWNRLEIRFFNTIFPVILELSLYPRTFFWFNHSCKTLLRCSLLYAFYIPSWIFSALYFVNRILFLIERQQLINILFLLLLGNKNKNQCLACLIPWRFFHVFLNQEISGIKKFFLFLKQFIKTFWAFRCTLLCIPFFQVIGSSIMVFPCSEPFFSHNHSSSYCFLSTIDYFLSFSSSFPRSFSHSLLQRLLSFMTKMLVHWAIIWHLLVYECLPDSKLIISNP